MPNTQLITLLLLAMGVSQRTAKLRGTPLLVRFTMLAEEASAQGFKMVGTSGTIHNHTNPSMAQAGKALQDVAVESSYGCIAVDMHNVVQLEAPNELQKQQQQQVQSTQEIRIEQHPQNHYPNWKPAISGLQDPHSNANGKLQLCMLDSRLPAVSHYFHIQNAVRDGVHGDYSICSSAHFCYQAVGGYSRCL